MLVLFLAFTMIILNDIYDTQRMRTGIADESGTLLKTRRSRQRILGREMLPLVWKEMHEVWLPSAISPAPSHIGATGQGPIGADEWRTFCTINLPITLIYQWESHPDGSRELQLLQNFMDLITAVKLATMRETSKKRLHDYRFLMRRYLLTALELFPGITLQPNHHLSLHLPEVMMQLGPAQAIWCFAFERMNYILQQTRTNNRIGKSIIDCL